MFNRLKKISSWCFVTLSLSFSPQLWAGLPKPPEALNIKDGNYAEGLISYGLSIMGYGCYLLAGLAFLFIGYEMIAAYQEAKRIEKVSHFFVWSLVGVFTLAVCLGLLYAGNNLISNAPRS